MSYDISNRLFSQRAAADMKAACELQDLRLLNFLARLVAAEICLSEWEEGFAAAVLYHHACNRQANKPTVLTEGQRRACEKLWKSYAHRMPIPAGEGRGKMEEGSLRSSLSTLRSYGPKPESERGTCDWSVRGEDGRRTRCGRKAVVRSPRGMEFCQDHHELRQAWKKRQKEAR